MPLYEEAARLAQANGFQHEAGLAYDLLADVHAERRDRESARSALHAVRALYSSWGAEALIPDVFA